MKEDDIEEGVWVLVLHSTKDFERVHLMRNALEDSVFRPLSFYLKWLENLTLSYESLEYCKNLREQHLQGHGR